MGFFRSQVIDRSPAGASATERRSIIARIQALSLTQICLVLSVLTLICYWPVTTYQFVNVDDQDYVTRNPNVQKGLTLCSFEWAFRTGYFCSWHPLTWLSHMVDYQCYGLNAGGHHLTNLLFHLANTVLLFLMLASWTGAIWRSGLVAALFACHPVHVESVAWISERKDVLSTFFFLLTLWFYGKFVALKPEPGSAPAESDDSPMARTPSWMCYGSALLFFACGLMSKSMLVTLPALLLVLDFWPFRRFGFATSSSRVSNLGPLILEKLPFFALALATSVVTFLAQRAGGAVSELAATPLRGRLENIPVAYFRYIQKTVWPADLAMFYPYPSHWPAALVVISLLSLAIVSGLAVRWRKSCPYLIVGWLWFLGTLVPVIGLIQVGGQSMADRYMYIPGIGLFIAAVWGLSALAPRLGRWQMLLNCAAVGSVIACLLVTSVQVQYWRDGVSLGRHTIQATRDNYFGYCYLGDALNGIGDNAGALACYAKAVDLAPQNLAGHFNLGSLLIEAGRVEEAVAHLQLAVAIAPGFVQAQNNLGIALMEAGQKEQAVRHFAEAARLDPADPDALFNLGRALLEQNRPSEAVPQFQSALRLRPDNAKVHYFLARALIRLHQTADAIFQYREALRLAPDSPAPINELAVILASDPDSRFRSTANAVELAERACELTQYQDPSLLTTLAAVYAQAGRCEEAIRFAQQARHLALVSNQSETAIKAGSLLESAASSCCLPSAF